MKTVIVCDSGLGGLNIAAAMANTGSTGEPCNMIYFNAYPAVGRGFNQRSGDEQEALFCGILESMRKFDPDLVLIACNTLSIIYERLQKYYRPPFPVEGIVDIAVDAMYNALQRSEEASLLILGTRSTVESGVYRDRLIERNIDEKRISALACPGLATLIESDPAAAAVSSRIREYAASAAELFENAPRKLLLGLCCTHFGFAGDFWLEHFSSLAPDGAELVNPNDFMGTGFCAEKLSYTARIGFFPGAAESMIGYFANRAPALAAALENAVIDENLFKSEAGI